MIIAYEVGTRLYLTDPQFNSIQRIRAHSVLLAFFQDFGVAGRFLPAIALVAVLIVWHILNNDRFRVRPTVLLGMAAESLVLTIPLVVFIGLLQMAFGHAAQPASPASLPGAFQLTSAADPLAKLPWKPAVTISLGAGLYEELLFRMIGILALHLIFVDLAKMSERVGTTLAVILCAAAFAAYHDVIGPGGEIDIPKAISLMAAGLYFGGVFAIRGFGLAVGVHVIYDVCVLLSSRSAV
jgi:membrane protease YdiL (CAAX protease family)